MIDWLREGWERLKGWVRKGLVEWHFEPLPLGRRVSLHEEQPTDRFVLSIALMIVFFAGLVALEAIHMFLFGELSDAIFNGIMLIVGGLVGALFGYREAPSG